MKVNLKNIISNYDQKNNNFFQSINLVPGILSKNYREIRQCAKFAVNTKLNFYILSVVWLFRCVIILPKTS